MLVIPAKAGTQQQINRAEAEYSAESFHRHWAISCAADRKPCCLNLFSWVPAFAGMTT